MVFLVESLKLRLSLDKLFGIVTLSSLCETIYYFDQFHSLDFHIWNIGITSPMDILIFVVSITTSLVCVFCLPSFVWKLKLNSIILFVPVSLYPNWFALRFLCCLKILNYWNYFHKSSKVVSLLKLSSRFSWPSLQTFWCAYCIW